MGVWCGIDRAWCARRRDRPAPRPTPASTRYTHYVLTATESYVYSGAPATGLDYFVYSCKSTISYPILMWPLLR